MSQVAIHKDDCACCGAEIAISMSIDDIDIPEDMVCPPCIVGLSHLLRNEKVTWARVVQVDVPGNAPLWWIVDSDEDRLEATAHLLHGSVYQSQSAQVSYGEIETHLYGSLTKDAAPAIEGVSDFTLQRDHLDDPLIRSLFDAIYDAALARQNG